LIDLTNLNDDCSAQDVAALCRRSMTLHGSVAAVCIWPRFVATTRPLLAGTGIKIATVVNFPHGGDKTLEVLKETDRALIDGADEIDLVMPYRAFVAGRRGFAETQICKVKAACGDKVLKVILETGEIGDPLLIHAAAQMAIDAGADFIKTSTGKVKVNATPEAAEIMLNVIEANRTADGRTVGFKPAGGIRTTAEAAIYLDMADRIMGANWVSAATFRFGASGLLDALVATIEGGSPDRKTGGEGY